MGAWVPERAVPWGLGRLPWVPGARPRGGSRPETTRVNSGHFQLSSLRFRIKIYVVFDVDFWSFGGRSWVPLGGHFWSCWRLFRPKLVSERSSNRLIFKKVIFHEIVRFPILLGQNGPQDGAKIDPRTLQDGSKIVLGRFFFVFNFRFDV